MEDDGIDVSVMKLNDGVIYAKLLLICLHLLWFDKMIYSYDDMLQDMLLSMWLLSSLSTIT